MATARKKSAARKALKAPRTKTATAARLKTRTTARAKATAKPRAKSTAQRRTKSAARQRGFFHIEVQPKEAFVEFKTQDIGSEGAIERIAGKRAGGSWSTQEWLIAKDHAHVERGTLIVAADQFDGID